MGSETGSRQETMRRGQASRSISGRRRIHGDGSIARLRSGESRRAPLTVKRHVENAVRRHGAQVAVLSNSAGQVGNVGQLRIQSKDELLPAQDLLVHLSNSARRGRAWRRGVLENDLGPSLKDILGDVKVPADSKEEGNLVLVDLLGVESRDLAPGASSVISVLEILGGQDQGREEHATATLKGAVGMSVRRLLGGKVVLGNVGLDENQIIERDLESRVASARATQRLLDEGSQRQHGLASQLTSACGRGEGPDGLDNLSRRINKTIDKVDLALRLANQSWRRSGSAVGARSTGVLSQFGGKSLGLCLGDLSSVAARLSID